MTLSERMDKEVEFYLKSRTMIHLEAAIASLLDCHTMKEVVKILRDQADQLEEFE